MNDWRVLSFRWLAVWRRNLLVWRKLSVPSLLGNFGDPLLYLLALGYGLGSFVGTLQGMPYITFLASGIICSSAMNTATFEALYSAYTRMTTQQTWAGMLATPLEVDDIVLGEMMWAGSKSLISAAAILIVAALLGLVRGWGAIWILPVSLLVGICFAAMALVITAVSRSYDFFLYYFTLVVTPMMLASGVVFPMEGLPPPIKSIAPWMPMPHADQAIRPLMIGKPLQHAPLHLFVLLAYAVSSYTLATRLLRRRLLN